MSSDLTNIRNASKTLLQAALERKADHIQVFDQTMSAAIVKLALEKIGPLDKDKFGYYALVGSSYLDLQKDPEFQEMVALSDKDNANAGLLGIITSGDITVPIISDYLWSDNDTVLPPNCLYIMAIDGTSVVGSVCVHLTPMTWHYPSTGLQ